MNITFCAYDSPQQIGGPNTVLRRLLPALEQQAHAPRALLFRTASLVAGATAQALLREHVEVFQTMQPRSTEAMLRSILQQMANRDSDVFAPDYVAPAYFASRWLRPAGIVTIGTIHGDDSFYHALIDEFVVGRPEFRLDGLVCVSQFVERTVLRRIGQQTTDTVIRCIRSGMPIPVGTAHPPTNRLRLVYTGRLAETHKRATDVARAMCRAARAIPGVEGIIYGDGPSQRMVEHILATEGAGLPVRLAGSVDNDRIQAELLASHALVLLSDSEGLPMAVMEAMACGVVPICLSVPSGALELVEHNVTGLLVDDRDASFVGAVRRLRDEPGLWQRLASAARDRIATQFTPERSAAQWIAFAEELRKQAGPRRLVQIPARFELPAVRPSLAHLDERELPFHRSTIRHARRALGYVRRRFRGG